MKKTPFGRIKKKLVPVFPHVDGGSVYLISTGFPDPNIYPEEVQETERNAGTVQYLLNASALRLASELGCTPSEAKRKFAPSIRQYNYEQYLDEHGVSVLRELLKQAAENLSRETGVSFDEANSRLGNPLQNKEEIVFDYTMYLNEAELNRLFDSMPTSDQRDKEIKACVTLAMRHRVARSVKVLDVRISDGSILIDNWFSIAGNEKIKINNQVGFLQSFGEQDGVGLITLKGFGINPSVGDDIFFLDSNNEYLYGWDAWDDADSLALKAITLPDGSTAYDAVYNFFLAEISGGARQEKLPELVAASDNDLGENKSNLPNGLPHLQLIGATSTGE